MKTFYLSIYLLVATAKIAAAVETTNASPDGVVLTPDYLSQLAEELRTNNPALRAAYERTNAALANLRSVRTWEDPVAKAGGLSAREPMRADEGDVIYGVEQKLPLFGKPRLNREVARAELATETAGVENQFQQLRSLMTRAAFRTALADQVVAIGTEDLAWLNLMSETLEAKYRDGQATLVEVLQIQNEQSLRVTSLQTDRNQLAQEKVTLNRLLNRDQSSPWPALLLPPPAGPVPFSERLANLALRNDPKSQVIREQIKQAEAEVARTRRDRLPDVSVGLEGRNYTGDGSFRQGMLILSMNLPWANGGKYRSEIDRDQSKLKATEFELADYQSGLREEIHQLTVRIDAERREALLYHDQILPRNESLLGSVRASWEAGRGSVRELLEARRMLLDARLKYASAVAGQYELLSELILCCGLGDLGAIEMFNAEPTATLPDKN